MCGAIQWHANGEFIATGGDDGYVKVWEASSGLSRPLLISVTIAPSYYSLMSFSLDNISSGQFNLSQKEIVLYQIIV
jgi:WD40 repeat protein